ncbi:MAG TPA: AraC family transcriptional regulator [Blastocatellia bacterium]|nr:AraC family transcriptional regulator [Blastocatellia bacterium]
MNHQEDHELDHEAQRIKSNQDELVQRIARAIPQDGVLEVFPGLFLARSCQPTEMTHSVFQPAFCVIAQGAKQVLLGEEAFRYDPGRYLISTVNLPIVSRVVEASVEEPYLSLRLNLDATLVASVIMESGIEMRKGDATVKAMDVSSIDANMLDAIVRLARLLETPGEIHVLAPLIIREIVYRLLRGEQGARLSHLLTSGAETRRISMAIERLREHFDQPLRIDEIARDLGMSVSGFHHHFKSVTAMSPLQFQKQIRLQEARRLMLGEDLDAASAGFRVGYEDPSYFSRDYKKLFGAPPQRDIARLRNEIEVGYASN